MVEHQTLAGVLGAAMAGTSIMLKQAMMLLKSAASSPDQSSFNDLSDKRWVAAVASIWKVTMLELKINHDHVRGDIEGMALEFA